MSNEIVSILIPARNEVYLQKTIENLLENAEEEIEIIAVLDGYWADPPIKDHPFVNIIHHTESKGQRQSINEAARVAKGKYIMKLDAHCAVDKGFDVKLKRDCEYDWTVIPRMYNLDIETFKPKLHKRTDYMYINGEGDRLLRAEYYGSRQPKNNIMIDDVMCNMGPCFFMHRDRFLELGGMDEGHGSWGQMGVEVSCKAWLSGGRLVVNKNTWFAHWFRGGGGPGFPYQISGRDQEKARKYSRDLWLNDKWEKQVRPFKWLVDKFNPPTWENYKWGKVEEETHAITNCEEGSWSWSCSLAAPEIYIPRTARSHVHGRPVRVENLYKNLEHYWDLHRKRRYEGFVKKAIPFFEEVHKGKTFTDEELLAHPYYQYIAEGYGQEHKSKFLRIMKDGIKLYHDIKTNGMSSPIDVWVENSKYNISRGTRRIVILKLLGKQTTTIRIFKNKKIMDKIRKELPCEPNSITAIAKKQFAQWGSNATDKYWIHSYTEHYDKHFADIRDTKGNILEIGVKRGGSIALWQEVFPSATIYGVDIDLSAVKLPKKMDRVVLLKGSQVDEKFNKEEVIADRKFVAIVDDASHRPEHQIEGFKLLWDSVESGGYYVIEDVYYRNYAMKTEQNVMTMLKDLIDKMNIELEIESMSFYYNIVFIKKR